MTPNSRLARHIQATPARSADGGGDLRYDLSGQPFRLLGRPRAVRAPAAEGEQAFAGELAPIRAMPPDVPAADLAALTGQRLGSVGRHLKVLRDARLLQRRRTGTSVLYYRLAEGDALVRAQDTAGGRPA